MAKIVFGASDAAVNSDAFANAYLVNFNTGTKVITAPVALNLTSTMTDDPGGALPLSSDNKSNDKTNSDNAVGIQGNLKGYLDTQYTSNNWTARYTGYSTANASSHLSNTPYPIAGLDQPILAIYSPKSNFPNGSPSSYIVLSSASTLPTSGLAAVAGDYYFSCFEKNTLISTPTGDVAVANLSIGDKVLTQDGRAVDIQWIGYQVINPFFALQHDAMPIKIETGALGGGLPKDDLYVSPDHAFLIDGLLVNASALVNGTTITQMQTWVGNVEYYHIETADHEIILAEGVPAETLLDDSGREKFVNYKEFQELFPQGKLTKELDFPRVKFSRQLPEHIKQKLGGALQAAEMAA